MFLLALVPAQAAIVPDDEALVGRLSPACHGPFPVARDSGLHSAGSRPTDSREPVVVGVDTHDQNHVAVLLDRLGRRLGKIEIPAERAGYQKLLSWCCAQGPLASTTSRPVS